MSKYFAVRHKKIGFVISYFIPIAWVIMLWDSKMIRKGILINVGIHVLFILIDMLDYQIDLNFFGGGLIGSLAVWWWYYSKCVNALKLKSDLLV